MQGAGGTVIVTAPLLLPTLTSFMCWVLYVTGWEEVVPLQGLSLLFLLKPLQSLPLKAFTYRKALLILK